MRKKFMAIILATSMMLTGISFPTSVYAANSIKQTKILQNKEDTYTLENYVTSLDEAISVEKKYFLDNKVETYKLTVDADADWKNKVLVECGYYFWSTIDNGDAKYYNMNSGITCFEKDQEELTDKDGKKYIVMTITNFGYDEFLEHRTKLQEVKKKFLATMPNLDEMSDYEKVLGILKFMYYIKYDYDAYHSGKTVDDAYTALTEGRATCVGYANAFMFLSKVAGLETKIVSGEVRNEGHAWNVVKICGKWYELEPQNTVNTSIILDAQNYNLARRGPFLFGTEQMNSYQDEYLNPRLYLDPKNTTARDNLPVNTVSYKDYKGHDYSNYRIKWNGDKATFYRICSECGEYENDGFEYDSQDKYYHYVDRKYTGTDCDVTKVSETKYGNATVTKYEASVTVDGKNYTSEHTVIDGECSHTVKDSDIKVIKKATCSEEGEVEKTCETCGYTWTESIPKTEHHYVTTTKTLDTCEEKSEYTVEKCSMCGSIKETSKKLYYSAHNFQFTSHKKEPTCTETGEDIYTCTKCNKTEIREVAAKGHGETELVNVKEPTCEEDGYTGDEKCKVCGQIARKGKKIEKLRHQLIGYNEKTYKTEADAEHEGLTLKYSYDMFIVECKRENCSYRLESVDESTKKLAGWILADGTEVEKEYGCQYEYVKDVSGNWMVKKIDGTTKPAENPTTKPAGAVKPSGETSGKKNEPTETKMKVPAKVKISSAKNLKGKKIAIKWKKVKKATKYQVKAVLGKKVITKTTTKASCTIKKLKKKKTYKIYVRAYNKAGYGKWSKAKKVTVKK